MSWRRSSPISGVQWSFAGRVAGGRSLTPAKGVPTRRIAEHGAGRDVCQSASPRSRHAGCRWRLRGALGHRKVGQRCGRSDVGRSTVLRRTMRVSPQADSPLRRVKRFSWRSGGAGLSAGQWATAAPPAAESRRARPARRRRPARLVRARKPGTLEEVAASVMFHGRSGVVSDAVQRYKGPSREHHL